MTPSPLKVAYITAGAAGMFCGSCMHDNTLARALTAAGVDVQLIPTYTPIRTDEEDVSVQRVFFGGINIYLQQKIPLFRHLPTFVDRFLDQPWLIRWLTARAVETSPQELGALTVSMLRGDSGYQRKEVHRLCDWLAGSHRPDLLNLSNMLIAGFVPAVKRQIDVPVLVSLQGDDIFLESLPEPHKSRAFNEIRRLVPHVDGFLVNSRYYADFMADYFTIPRAKLHVVPLGLDTSDFRDIAAYDGSKPRERPPTVGYLARLAPEKGLHVLADAFIQLRQRPAMADAQLRIAGWLGKNNQKYVDGEFAKLREAGLDGEFHYAGSVDRAGKVQFLQDIDVLTVPTVYHEPKGIFVLEALAAGVPVVQPEHGAFPELLAATGGGRLVRPADPSHLADVLHELLSDPASRIELGRQGREAVHGRFNADAMAQAVLGVYRQFVGS